MNRKFIGLMFLISLSILSIFQIVLDYTFDSQRENAASISKDTEYYIYIQIEDKTLYLLQNGKCIKQYPIASGRSGLPSPLGTWKIIEKSDWGEGFGGSWMGLDIPWGTYGIHGTLAPESIGSGASAGCIRMFSRDAAELYDIVPVGTEVAIVNGLFGPFGRGYDEINPGDRGADVLAIQQRLKQLGYYKGNLDGIYEDDLKLAVHNFQRANHLTAENTVTRETWLKMGFREFE